MVNRFQRAASLVALITVSLAASAISDRERLETQNGYVSLQTPSDWTLVTSKAHRATASALFQIPNPADRGTPDSTSLGLAVYDLGTDAGRADAARAKAKLTSAIRAKHRQGPWVIYRQRFADDADPVPYTALNARQETPGLVVTVDLSWPKLPDNPADYDAQMEKLFRAFIGSVQLHQSEAPAANER